MFENIPGVAGTVIVGPIHLADASVQRKVQERLRMGLPTFWQDPKGNLWQVVAVLPTYRVDDLP